MRRAAAPLVDVLDAQQEATARRPRQVVRQDGEAAWPRCSRPVGDGAKRVVTGPFAGAIMAGASPP